MNRTMTVKPGIRRRCQVALCSNMVSNSIARTDAPGGANLLICDDCLREAFEARFGRVYTAQDVAAKDTEIAQLRGKIEAMEREIAISAQIAPALDGEKTIGEIIKELHCTAKEDTAPQVDKILTGTIPAEKLSPAPKPKDKPAGGRKR